MQLAADAGTELNVCVVEKGSEVGAHILSGAVLEPTALNELFPDWQERGAPVRTRVRGDEVYYLTSDTARHPGAGAVRAGADAQRGQLHYQPRRVVSLDGRAGRSHGGEYFSRFRGRRCYLRRRTRCGRYYRRHGGRRQRRAQTGFRAGLRTAGPLYDLFRGLPRQSRARS